MKRVLWLSIIMSIAISKQLSAQVGIGTDTPEHTLHIRPATESEDPVKIEGLQYAFAGDTAILVVNPVDGIVRYVTISELLKNVTLTGPIDSSVDQNAFQVPLHPQLDINGDGKPEHNVQQALERFADKMPKGTFSTIGEARKAGLQDGDSFYADPKGIFGCSGCVITLHPGMK